MGRIDTTRVIVGGLVAGVVLNVGEYLLNGVLLRERWEAAMETLGREPYAGADIMVMVVMTLLLGVVLVWFYAAMRPRFGPGPKTAVITALFGWLLLYVWPFFWNSLTGLFPSDLMLIMTVWGLFELPVAVMAGAWLYKEEEPPREPVAGV
ncbi:MAG: hypothetical protein R3199_02510 [Gemmatimonadota bacterium]|nr:hypothetical protein [Gemmatimonadota bacterium]